MKKLLLFTTLLFTSTCILAEQDTQPSSDTRKNDVLITSIGDTINCQIFAISDDEVKYRKAGSQIEFSTKVKNLNTILLSTGDSILYKNQAPKQNEKIKFNKEPFDQNKYKFGIVIGYESQQCNPYDKFLNMGRLVGIYEGTFTPAFKLGFIAHPEIRYGIGIKTGLNFNLAHEGDSKLEALRFSVDIPVQIAYRYQIVKDWSVFIYTGPVFEFGLYIGEGVNNVYEKTCPLYYHRNTMNYQWEYRGFNCMWAIGIGAQYKRYRLTIGGEFGLNNLISYSDDYKGTKSTYKINKPIQVSVAVLF